MSLARIAALAALAVIAGLAVATAAPATETAAAACRGTLKVELGNAELRVRAIRTSGMSCRAGKRLIRRFFAKADSEASCRREAAKAPPTPGCSVGRFQCWRRSAKYCAREGQDVSWRDRRV